MDLSGLLLCLEESCPKRFYRRSNVCGFIGAFGSAISDDDVDNGLRVISHRGPDGTQAKRIGQLYLASCRLAIHPPYDDSPLQSTGNEVLALNGEIYNFLELTATPPVDTSSITDTNLLARVLSIKGKTILPALQGLFAFCFSDGQRVLLARDRFGIKPLYYARLQKGLVFASEMKALLSLPGLSRELDEDVISSITIAGHNLFPGKTPFRQVQSLKPGHFIEYSVGEELQEKPFALIPHPPMPGAGVTIEANEAAERAEELLAASVSRTVQHDPHPKALFFSGGLDSSLLLDLARRHSPVTCFVLSDRSDADDLIEARRVTQALGVRLEERSINETELAREIVSYAWHFEQPIAGGAFDLFGGVAFHALARSIGKDYKVALCGEGADELFLGYHRLHMQPEIFAESLRNRLGAATPMVRQLLEASHLLEQGPLLSRAVRDLALHQGLADYHLASVDRSGMTFGLEIRPAYLDNELAAWATSLDESALIDRNNNWTKLPLRSIAMRRFSQPGTERVAVRRKWAMPSAIELCSKKMVEQLNTVSPHRTKDEKNNLDQILMDLFVYLHVDPGCTSPPDFSLFDFVNDLRRPGRMI
ncbi:MAG: asparagine synthase-related protein [Deltaproteobacteria bacterium]|nr:asparagine synthase-related protein [Deltaproteobacteria bacterium]